MLYLKKMQVYVKKEEPLHNAERLFV